MTLPQLPAQNGTELPRHMVGDPDEEFKLLGRLRRARISSAAQQTPELQPPALDGLAGEIVTALQPLTEATPAAMLGTILATFGVMAGRHAHVCVGAKQHFPNIYVVVIGSTAKARKGTSAAAVRPILLQADDPSDPFFPGHQLTGVQSGEALIRAVAQSGDSSTPVPDQRTYVYEEEYGRLLAAAGRKDATLSATLRTAWDGDEITRDTIKETMRATHPHVGIVAHVTQHELVKMMTKNDSSNGYANRFLHVFSERTTVHPEPGKLHSRLVKDFGDRLAQRLSFARSVGEVARSASFVREWDAVYRIVEYMPDGGEVFDELSARAPAHLLRLSLIYALLDGSSVLEAKHLTSALAFWEYCESTVAHVWGASLGDSRTDKLYQALLTAGDAGLDRTQVSSLFSNNLLKDEVNALTESLTTSGLAVTEQRPTGGRPRQVLIAVT
ncbi:DUF3987 domain-containing protein [Aeromicrobium sp. CFBP 8757]|uniref:DUF3987 domain-containing protein n=1 Tax=Aeromicrobium sp. CFBP 8757 TaxID=2775288 RepID=UPI00177FB50D|nr:DUF3987 domain-containing protein [Aeromicrobium sp. CFBP 8757]MBD8607565.1 DUF3987 domain-containing protein [Aeromicrobium sp. CFBP 8757]